MRSRLTSLMEDQTESDIFIFQIQRWLPAGPCFLVTLQAEITNESETLRSYVSLVVLRRRRSSKFCVRMKRISFPLGVSRHYSLTYLWKVLRRAKGFICFRTPSSRLLMLLIISASRCSQCKWMKTLRSRASGAKARKVKRQRPLMLSDVGGIFIRGER